MSLNSPRKTMRSGLTCIVWYAELETAVDALDFTDWSILVAANVGNIFEISIFQTVPSKVPPSVPSGGLRPGQNRSQTGLQKTPSGGPHF